MLKYLLVTLGLLLAAPVYAQAPTSSAVATDPAHPTQPSAMGIQIPAVPIVAPAGSKLQINNDGSVVMLKPLEEVLLQYILDFLMAASPFILGWILTLLHINLSQNTKDRIIAAFKQAASSQAGAIYASLDATDAMNLQIKVNNPLIVQAANKVLTRLPDDAKKVGMTDEIFRDWVAGELGKLQAGTPTTTSTVAQGEAK